MKKTEEPLVDASKAPYPEAQYQRRLLPLDVLTTYPNNTGSADMQLIVEGRDGLHYALKTIKEGNGYIPASEYFCYELASSLYIPTPGYAFIRMSDGSLCFGSKWEGGAINGVNQIDYQRFILDVLSNKISVNNFPVFLSRVYAFDLFVNNCDRHWGNYIWRDSYSGSIVALAYDFGRAWFETGFASDDARHPDCNTQICYQTALQHAKIDHKECLACLEDIRSIKAETAQDVLSNLPSEWLSDDKKMSFLEWWESPARGDRIDSLATFIEGGN